MKQAERKSSNFDPLPDADNAAVGSHNLILSGAFWEDASDFYWNLFERGEVERPDIRRRGSALRRVFAAREAVFRRERRPVSLDRPSRRARGPPDSDREATLPWLPNSLYHFNGVCNMKKNQVKKLAVAALLCAVAVAGSTLSFPVFGSKCAPVQHMVNILFAVFLGPWYGLAGAFTSSLLRNLMSLGSLMAFPGSMFGALLCGLAYRRTGNLLLTLAAEVFGTAILGGLSAYPVAIFLMGQEAGSVAFYAYIVPFLISTAAGSILSGILVFSLQKAKALKPMQETLA